MSEIMSLGLEELLNLEISRREPLGIHHTHNRGEFMLNISTGYMSMRGSSSQQSAALSDFMVAPTKMDMEMLMVGGMYAPTERITIMAMVPYAKKSMDHVTRMGDRFTTKSSGLGDTKLSGLITLWRGDRAKVHVELGTWAPTGSITVEDTTPARRIRLPYPMQLGSGTWNVLSGITYQGYRDKLSWGANADVVIPTGRNDHDYRLGSRRQVSIWGSYLVTDWMSSHVRLDGHHWQSISGADPALNPNMVPTADPELQGGRRIDLGLGINTFFKSRLSGGQRLSVEFRSPVYQRVNRYQLETDWSLHFSWSWVGAKFGAGSN